MRTTRTSRIGSRPTAELQITTGLTWNVGVGRLGVGVTENVFNYDNTSDLAVHLSYGVVIE